MAKTTYRPASVPARIGDVERRECADLLSEGYATGRLTAGELEQRTEFALTARSQSELDLLVADLAAAVPVRRPTTARRIVGFAAVLGVLTALLVLIAELDPAVAMLLWIFGCLAGGAGAILRGPGSTSGR